MRLSFLYETWTSEQSNIDITGYFSHNFFRKFRHRNAKRGNGGLALYIKDSIKDGVKVVRNRYDTIIWVKLEKTFFHFESDVYIAGVYLWREGSPSYDVHDVDFFYVLQRDICEFVTVGSVFFSG